jgi:hypothetical protein
MGVCYKKLFSRVCSVSVYNSNLMVKKGTGYLMIIHSTLLKPFPIKASIDRMVVVVVDSLLFFSIRNTFLCLVILSGKKAILAEDEGEDEVEVGGAGGHEDEVL